MTTQRIPIIFKFQNKKTETGWQCIKNTILNWNSSTYINLPSWADIVYMDDETGWMKHVWLVAEWTLCGTGELNDKPI